MGGFIEGRNRQQTSLLPACVDDYVGEDALIRMVDAVVQSLDLAELGFRRAMAAATGRPGYHPGDMPRLYIWGYLNQLRSSRHLERAWLIGQSTGGPSMRRSVHRRPQIPYKGA